MARKKTVSIDLTKLTTEKVKVVKGDKGTKSVTCRVAASLAEATQALGGKAETILAIVNAYFTNYQVAPVRLELSTNIIPALVGMLNNMINTMAKFGTVITPEDAVEKVRGLIPIPVSAADWEKAVNKVKAKDAKDAE